MTAVIPARLDSQRLPRKVLVSIDGRPLLWHVWKAVYDSRCFDEVLVCTDSDELIASVTAWGGVAVPTRTDCRNGTERVGSILNRITTDWIVNIQADMPHLPRSLFDSLCHIWTRCRSEVITPVCQIRDPVELTNPHLVKAVITHDGRAIYFSRQPIPFLRDVTVTDWPVRHVYWGHIGIYGYSRDALSAYCDMPASVLEQAEGLEQLRFIDAGLPIQTFAVPHHPITIDSFEDLTKVKTSLIGIE